jgi:murein DD-endopeptidase MepM/ murein hydrolase activator NlpD
MASEPVSRRARSGRVSQALWSPPPDDRPSQRTMALTSTALAVMAVAAAGFLAWAVSVDRGPRTPLLGPEASDDRSTPPSLQRAVPAEVEGSVTLGPAGVASTQGAVDAGAIDAIDDAVGSCLPGEGLRDGAVVRLLGGHDHLAAVEYRPPGAKPARYYGFTAGGASGYFDETGQRVCSTGWQSPLASLRRTSPFNPHRMHPILHRLMPHEGTDFGAPKGTPVYAARRGVVDWAGPHGAHGNWVAILHPDGIETGYAHLSRILPGLKRGDAVHAHQIIGYVGSTGRSTGPHLHFSARKDGAYFNAETLLAPATGGVPAPQRAAFLAAKAELDQRLDGIPLPGAPAERRGTN